MNRFKKWLIPVALVCLLLATLIGCSEAPQSLGQIYDPSGNPFANRFTDVKDIRTATFVVAASDSVHKYEADYFCNGTDDHVQIQAALDKLPDTGGEVFLLDGTYNVEVSVALDSYQTLIGCGQNTILTTTTTALDIVTATGGDGSEKVGILIADLCVDGTIGGAVNNDNGIKWTYVDYSKISNVWVRDNKEEGIYLDFCDLNTIVGNYVSGSSWENLYIQDSYKNTITANVFEGGSSNEIILWGSTISCSYNAIVGNIIQGSTGGVGIQLTYADDNTISGNTIQGNLTNGIYLSEGRRNTITGNNVQGNGTNGIEIYFTTNNVISSNVCRLNGTNGIYLYYGDDNSVTDNICIENSQTTDDTSDNIKLNASDRNLISGNLCRQGSEANQPQYGINISTNTCDRNCLIGNDLYDSGKTGDLNDVAVANPTLKHDNRDLAGTGWLPEV